MLSNIETITQLPESLCPEAGGVMDIHRRDEDEAQLRWRPMYRLWLIPCLAILVSPVLVFIQAVMAQHFLLITIGTLSPLIGLLLLLAAWIISGSATHLRWNKSEKTLTVKKRAYKKELVVNQDQIEALVFITHTPESEQLKKNAPRDFFRLDLLLNDETLIDWTSRPVSRVTLLHHADHKKIKTWTEQLQTLIERPLRYVDLSESVEPEIVQANP